MLLSFLFPVIILSEQRFLGAQFRNTFGYFSGNSKASIKILDSALFPAYEGFEFKRGFNVKNSVYFELGIIEDEQNSFRLVAEPFFSLPPEKTEIFIHRFSTEVKFWLINISGGKNTLSLGPGAHNSILLSHNIPPQKFVDMKLYPVELPCIGDFCLGSFMFEGGLLFVEDKTQRFEDPNFLIMRMEWELYFTRWGASRIISFGGKGGWYPRTLQDYFDLLTARVENAIGTCVKIQDPVQRKACEEYWSSRDTNQAVEVYGVIDIERGLRLLFDTSFFDEFLGYFEYGADDLVACWQVEDREIKSCFPLPFSFTDVAWVVGLQGKISSLAFLTEYSWTNKFRKFYSHKNYPLRVEDNYTGIHSGPLSDDFWLRVFWNFSGFYAGGRFHFTSRWRGEEKIFEFGPIFAYDFNGGKKTIGGSLVFMLSQNPDNSKDPFLPSLKRGKFFDVIASLFFSSVF